MNSVIRNTCGSGSDLQKEHCLYLNSDYKVGPYDKYYLKLLSQSECVFNNLPPCCSKNVYFCLTKPLHIAIETYYADSYGDKQIEKTYNSQFLTSSSASISILTSSPISWNGAQYFISENCLDSRRNFIDC